MAVRSTTVWRAVTHEQIADTLGKFPPHCLFGQLTPAAQTFHLHIDKHDRSAPLDYKKNLQKSSTIDMFIMN